MSEKYGRKVKRLMIDEMKDLFTGHKGFLISSQTNLSATDMDELRASLRKVGSRYFVVKNRLARIALNEADFRGLGEMMEQDKTLGIGVVADDPVIIAKKMKEFAKKNKGFDIFSGYLGGKVLTEEAVRELADLPSREELLARVVGTMNAPVSSIVSVMSSILRSVLYALNGIKEKKEEQSN